MNDYLFFEQRKGVHAEMQILSRITDTLNRGNKQLPKEIYIGISKRCCLECHCMLEAANKVLESKGISIIFENAHDAKFDGWIAPSGFKINKMTTRSTKKAKSFESMISQKSKQTISLQEQIVEEYYKLIAVLKARSSFNQRHPTSDSDTSFSSGEKLLAYKKQLEKDLVSFQRRQQVDCSMLLLGLELCEVERFKLLFDDDFCETIKNNIGPTLGVMIAELNNARKINSSKEKISEERLLNFLQNQIFATEEMVSLFKDKKLSFSI